MEMTAREPVEGKRRGWARVQPGDAGPGAVHYGGEDVEQEKVTARELKTELNISRG